MNSKEQMSHEPVTRMHGSHLPKPTVDLDERQNAQLPAFNVDAL